MLMMKSTITLKQCNASYKNIQREKNRRDLEVTECFLGNFKRRNILNFLTPL